MKIDTLILSGASTKAPIYIGIFRYLYENNILDKELTGINHIVCCSISMLFSFYILLELDIDIIEACVLNACFENALDTDNIDIKDLFDHFGLFSNDIISTLIKNMLKEKINKDDLTLKELYEIKPILLSVKCANITKGCIEYINKDTNPEISIITLFKMTTAIPFMFKPIKYDECYYVDGGLTGGYPIEFIKGNYLGIWIRGPDWDIKKEIKDIIEFIIKLNCIKPYNVDHLDNKRTIIYMTDLHFSEFSVDKKTKLGMIKDGYNITKAHIEDYKLTNDLFNKQNPAGKDPTLEDPC